MSSHHWGDEPGDTWHAAAACIGLAHIFDAHDPTTALTVCGTCPVTAECLSEARTTETASTTHGVRGGLTAEQRIATAPRVCHRCEAVPLPAGTQRRYCPPCTQAQAKENRARSQAARVDTRRAAARARAAADALVSDEEARLGHNAYQRARAAGEEPDKATRAAERIYQRRKKRRAYDRARKRRAA